MVALSALLQQVANAVSALGRVGASAAWRKGTVFVLVALQLSLPLSPRDYALFRAQKAWHRAAETRNACEKEKCLYRDANLT